MIIAGTGHRPDKLGGYSDEAFEKVVITALIAIDELQPAKVISGMALGWDQALALAAIHRKVPLLAALPFRGQDILWPETSRLIFRRILERATEVKIVCKGGYASWKMAQRNNWMVQNCDEIAALHNGSTGGTNNCLMEAKKKKKVIHNYWDHFLRIEKT